MDRQSALFRLISALWIVAGALTPVTLALTGGHGAWTAPAIVAGVLALVVGTIIWRRSTVAPSLALAAAVGWLTMTVFLLEGTEQLIPMAAVVIVAFVAALLALGLRLSAVPRRAAVPSQDPPVT